MSWLTREPVRGSAPPGREVGSSAKPKPRGKGDIPPRQAWWTFLAVLVVNYLLVRLLFPGEDSGVTVPYTAFKEQVAKDNVEAIYSQGANIEGRFRTPVLWPPPATKGSVPV